MRDQGASSSEPMNFLDRRRECRALDGLLAHARTGRSGALVVLGEPGVGKSALLRYAVGAASDLRVLQASGVESEMELPFAGVHQLCLPILDRLEGLPGPQSKALSTAFGLSPGAVPDRFLTGLAVLSLLSDVAEERPLLCVVDDAQWLDQASAQALGFVARRLLAESVVVLFGARTIAVELQDAPRLAVAGLPETDARELLRSVIPGRVDDIVEDQIVAETRGNPLALLELPRGLAPAQLAGGFGMAGALPLSSRIEERFQRRYEALPDEVRRLLLVAAAETTGDPALLLRAAEALGVASRVWASDTADLLEVGGRVRFRHPLIRSAVYRAASAEERRAVHLALSEAIDGQTDPDRRAWYLAEATSSANEEVARELERAADRARARGGLAAASAFLERATALTPDATRRAERALSAAQAKYEAGLLDDASALLATAEVDALGDLQLAKVNLVRAGIAFATRRGGDAPPLLLRAARRFEAADVQLARATYLDALAAAMFAGRLARGAGVVEVSEAALASPWQPSALRPAELLLRGLAVRFTEGYAAAAPILKDALDQFRRDAAPHPEDARWLWLASWVASELWDDETWALLSARQLELVRAAGALTAVPLALSARISFLQQVSGALTAAASMVGEMRAVTEATGIATPPYGALWHVALSGRAVEAQELISTIVSEAEARGEGFALAITEHASAVMFNGLGRYDEALSALAHTGKWGPEIGGPTWAVAELIEAAIRCRRLEVAEGALGRLATMTQASGSDWALAIEARSRALLSEGQRAESLYREAIARFGRTYGRVELARAHLLYGEWLRREQRRMEAREQLRIAHGVFTGMGVEAFVGRCERELSATGERVSKRSLESSQELTAQEDQIARLARDGLSNSAVGARLFLSPRTVEYHLHKVFTKLGIDSRRDLDRVLPREPSVVIAAK